MILGLWNLATVCILGRKAIGITWGSRRDLTRWLPVAVLSVASMWTFLYALESATLSAVVTWRNLAPMPTVRRRTEPAAAAPRRHRRAAGTTSDAPPPLAPRQMFVECCCFSKFHRDAGATAALALIATGVILYSAFDLQFSRLGTLFIVTNTVLVVAETAKRASRTQGASRTPRSPAVSLTPAPPSATGTSGGCSSTTPTPSTSRSKQ